jgi:hypothetical protein
MEGRVRRNRNPGRPLRLRRQVGDHLSGPRVRAPMLCGQLGHGEVGTDAAAELRLDRVDLGVQGVVSAPVATLVLEATVALRPLVPGDLDSSGHGGDVSGLLERRAARVRRPQRVELREDPFPQLVAGVGECVGDMRVKALQAALATGAADAELER